MKHHQFRRQLEISPLKCTFLEKAQSHECIICCDWNRIWPVFVCWALIYHWRINSAPKLATTRFPFEGWKANLTMWASGCSGSVRMLNQVKLRPDFSHDGTHHRTMVIGLHNPAEWTGIEHGWNLEIPSQMQCRRSDHPGKSWLSEILITTSIRKSSNLVFSFVISYAFIFRQQRLLPSRHQLLTARSSTWSYSKHAWN